MACNEIKTHTIQEAKQIVLEQPYVKLSHPYFSTREYIYGDIHGNVCDEDGIILPWNEFWELRMVGGMKDGWYKLEDNV